MLWQKSSWFRYNGCGQALVDLLGLRAHMLTHANSLDTFSAILLTSGTLHGRHWYFILSHTISCWVVSRTVYLLTPPRCSPIPKTSRTMQPTVHMTQSTRYLLSVCFRLGTRCVPIQRLGTAVWGNTTSYRWGEQINACMMVT